MATVSSIKAKIKTILETKEGAGQPLNEVYGCWEQQPEKFPCAILEYFESGLEKRDTTAENEVNHKYKIRIAIRDTNNQTESDLRMSLIEDMTNLFRTADNVDTLDSEVHRFEVESVKAFNSSEDMQYSGFDIIISTFFLKTFS